MNMMIDEDEEEWGRRWKKGEIMGFIHLIQR